MTEAHPHRHIPLQKTMPMLLSFVAGYVDSYTYLALFGLFVAQVTGSFVIAAAAITAALIALAREYGRAPMPWMLALEAVLLAAFVAIVMFGPGVKNASDWHGIVAGLFAACAMGTQSVLVRLLMKGIPQTNVMTGNMTQLGIAVTDLIVARRRFARSSHDAAAVQHYHVVRDQLLVVLSVAGGFLIGAAAGAAAFVTIGISGALLAVAIVVALALWSLVRGDET